MSARNALYKAVNMNSGDNDQKFIMYDYYKEKM